MGVSRSNELGGLAGIEGGFAPLDSGLLIPAAYLPSGTAMPSQPGFGNNRPFWRTDLGMSFFYDGTRWLSTTLYREPVVLMGTAAVPTATSSIFSGTGSNGDYSIYVETAYLLSFAASLTAANYWTYELLWANDGNPPTYTSLGSANSSADTSSVWYNKKLNISAVIDGTLRAWRLTVTKTGAPGGTYVSAVITYRIVGT